MCSLIRSVVRAASPVFPLEGESVPVGIVGATSAVSVRGCTVLTVYLTSIALVESNIALYTFSLNSSANPMSSSKSFSSTKSRISVSSCFTASDFSCKCCNITLYYSSLLKTDSTSSVDSMALYIW